MYFKSLVLMLLLAALSMLAGGCGNSRIPSPADLPIVYKIDVQQGNLVTQDMLAQLQPGMDRAKVKYIMGTPLMIDTFHPERWDYIYSMQERGGERSQRRVSLFFKNDRLERIEGDVTPARGAIARSESGRATTVEVPAEEKGLVSRLKDSVTGDDTKKEEKTSAAEKAAAVEPAAPKSEAVSAGERVTTAEPPTPEAPSPPAEGGDFVIDNAAGEGLATSAPSETPVTDADSGPSSLGEAPATAAAPDTPIANAEAAPSSVGEAPVNAATSDTPVADAESAPSNPGDEPLLPRFQSESSLEDAVLRDDSSNPSWAAARASEAAVGADSRDDAGTGTTAAANTTTEVTIPEDAPPPPKKGFFRRMLERVGVGDNEGGEYESADIKHRDPTNPDTQ